MPPINQYTIFCNTLSTHRNSTFCINSNRTVAMYSNTTVTSCDHATYKCSTASTAAYAGVINVGSSQHSASIAAYAQ
jgi:hypothetical protein